MKRDFEEYFPLPWHIKRRTVCWEMGVEENFIYLDLNGDSGRHASEVVPSLIDFTARRNNVEFNKYDVDNAREDALKYIVQCANLMPEAVELLDDAQNIMKWTCELCDGEACGRCGGCDVKGIGSRIAALLAKLEGGMGE